MKPSRLAPPSGALLLAGLAFALAAGIARAGETPLLLVSLDGFRWNYTREYADQTPVLRRLAAEGISARGLIPAYPSTTFPNHYTLVTGLYPAHHGIINNDMFDPGLGRYFHYYLPADNHDPRWWGGEPIWVTAVKQGRKSAAYYWVGAGVAVGGIRPTYSIPYPGMSAYKAEPFSRRIERVVGWLKLPAEQRPAVIAFYVEETDSVGHASGPDSPEMAAAVNKVDSELGALLDRLRAEGIAVNVVVVSDHGMTGVSPERVIYLDDYVDLATVQVDFQGVEAGLRPLQGTPRDLVRSLAGLAHARAYLTDNGEGPAPAGPDLLPARFHLTGNPRIPPVWVAADEGWRVVTRASFRAPRTRNMKGDHGYDPADLSMEGILIAWGPAFRTGGQVIGAVDNVQVYDLLCAALHLQPAPNDGDGRLARAFLKEGGRH